MSTYLVPPVAPRTKHEIENDAESFLAKHFPERLVKPGRTDVLEMWELLGDVYDLEPGVAELSDGVEGMTWPDGRVQVNEATYRGAHRGQGRPRFTMCHEVYHGLAHRSQIRRVLVDTGELTLYRRSDIPTQIDPEWQANVFAAALLMPRAMVKLVDKEARNAEIADMVYYFGVSPTAARVRLSSLRRNGYLPPSQWRREDYVLRPTPISSLASARVRSGRISGLLAAGTFKLGHYHHLLARSHCVMGREWIGSPWRKRWSSWARAAVGEAAGRREGFGRAVRRADRARLATDARR